jgi:hypothetical protein
MTSIRRLQPDEVAALTLVPAISRRSTPRVGPWSPADDTILRADYPQHTAAEIGARLGRTVEAIRQRARFLGLARSPQARIRWTADADALLRAQYGHRSVTEIAAEVGTTAAAVYFRARTIGLAASRVTRAWRPDEDRLLRELYGAVTPAALAKHLGRTESSIVNRVHTLGLTRETTVANRYQRDQDTITQLRGEVQRLRDRPPLEPAYAPGDDARRLATLIAWRLSVVSAAQAAVVLGVPVERLPVELGRAAKRGLDVVTSTLEEG